jgi:acyl-CoA thioesterase-1
MNTLTHGLHVTRSAARNRQMGSLGRAINLTMPILAVLFGLLMLMPIRHSHAEPGARPLKIIAFGDSLTAGFGLAPGQSFPEVLQFALEARGAAVEVVNAGVSGDTTAAGLARLDWVIGEDADGVIVELGANDALRGQPPAQARANLDAILTRLAARKLPVLLAGMRAPENWGEDYRATFDAIYPALAAKHGAILYPFFLDGVALDRKLNLDDGLHPNARGIAMIVERMLPSVERLIVEIRSRKTAARG